MKKDICEICNNEFYCNSSDIKKCWCFEIPPKIINNKYKSCICKECLVKTSDYNKLI